VTAAAVERAVAESGQLNDLEHVLGRRFECYGFPLRLETAYGPPVRAVGIVDD
jgi:kynurenine formamidase